MKLERIVLGVAVGAGITFLGTYFAMVTFYKKYGLPVASSSSGPTTSQAAAS